MPNVLNANGLTLKTRAELVTEKTAALKKIYGDDINLASDTPDGQAMNIEIQAILDMQDLLLQIYNSVDPDKAFGVVLDARVAYNGIQRQAGTFTLTNVTISMASAQNLYGLDQESFPVFTVQDDAGNKWFLVASVQILAPGDYVLQFRAEKPGAVLTTPNTITTPVTIVLGVDAINNPTTYTVLGINEESDAALKLRRQKSVALSSQGYRDGLEAALQNITGISFTKIYENDTNATDADGVPSHSIWVIVSGNAGDQDIAQAIYRKRGAGCGMRGAKTFPVAQADGSLFIVRWDTVVAQNLFIKFTASSLDGVNPPNIALILSQLPSVFVPGVAEKVNINSLSAAVRSIDPNTLVTGAGFSTTYNGTYTNTLAPTAKNQQFAVAGSRVIITPIVIAPPSASIAAGGATKQFSASGGYGAITWSKTSGNGTINSSGLFTSAASGTTVIRATDANGNYSEATITVV